MEPHTGVTMVATKTAADTRVAEPPATTDAFYAPRPTRATLFFRTFLPWQAIRFAVINLKMLRLIRRSHRA